MKNLLCGEAPEWLKLAFLEYDINVIENGRCSALQEATAHHIDLVLVKVGDRWFSKDDIEAKLSDKYPGDVLLNVASLGNTLILNPNTCAKEILDYATERNMNIIKVKQGYTKCSTLVVNNHAIITEDEGIYKAVLESSLNIDALLIKKGYVSLPGYDYGFIGGASVAIDKNVFFFGAIQKHPDYDKIKLFIDSQGKQIIQLSNDKPLLDIGGCVEYEL